MQGHKYINQYAYAYIYIYIYIAYIYIYMHIQILGAFWQFFCLHAIPNTDVTWGIGTQGVDAKETMLKLFGVYADVILRCP